ncbi:M13 family metallopeptidase [bacterium SCSIO 12643]|nr:M13 family metallopeptidase [bacterium SCSIO 12643]
MKFNQSIFILPLVALATSCASDNATVKQEEKPVVEKHHGLDLSNMDESMRVQDDFFMHVNGNWVKNTEIPGDQGSWGAFNELRENNNKVVLEVLESASSSNKYDANSDQKKAANFYAVGMDSTAAEKAGLTPLDPFFSKIDAISNKDELVNYLAYEETYGGGSFFGFAIFPNVKNSNVKAAYLAQDGLGLPDSDYYSKTDEKSVDIQNKYKAYISNMLTIKGQTPEDAKANAEKIYELEADLASASMNSTESRNLQAQYNPYKKEDLSKLAPSINWDAYFKTMGIEDLDTLIVMQPKFIQKMEDIINANDIELWKNYLTYKIMSNYAGYLNNEMVQTSFDFYGKELSGTTEMRDRWKRVLSATNRYVGEAIGKLYVDAVFPPEAKETAKEMVSNILDAMKNRIQNLDWMTEETKVKAQEKLASFTVKIGYPDKWKDYSSLDIKTVENGGSYAGNAMAAKNWNFRDEVAKLHEPVDKSEWGMTPQTVNAYYNPLANEIVFPAAILQPPFFDFNADAPVNYGGIGAVIGHEISHGFDDQGSQFDASGNMVNWWTETDLKQFQERGQKLIAQFDAIEALPGVHVNGKLTLGENIGDLGGVNLAWDALQAYFKANGKTETIDGLTPEERFFMSWGTIWRTKYRDEALRSQINTNPHAPGMYRANEPLRNVDAFYEVFKIQENDSMYIAKDDRVSIW